MKIKKNCGFSDEAIRLLVSCMHVTFVKNLSDEDKEIHADITDNINESINSDYRVDRYWRHTDKVDPTSTYLEYDNAGKLLGTMSFKAFKGIV
jgi:hypothetical protein